MPIPFIGSLSRNSIPGLLVTVFSLLALTSPLSADPVPSLDQITVLDQGSQILLTWHFYPRLLPQKISLPPGGAQIILDDPATRKQNLATLAASAFALTLDGKPAPLTQITDLNLAADGGCYATLLYPGRKNARLLLRETLLPLYPPSYVINYEIYSPLNRARGVTGYLTGGAPSPVIEYTQIGDDYQPSLFDALSAQPVRLFKAELRAAWINPNWLFLTLIVLLLRPARELYPLAWTMAVAWILPSVIWAGNGAQLPVPLPHILPALATALLGVVLIRTALPLPAAALALAVAGLLNGCYEVQQTTLERPVPTGANLTGLVLGLVAGFALVFAAGLPIVAECRKVPGFQHDWAPRIAVALALGALVLAFL